MLLTTICYVADDASVEDVDLMFDLGFKL